MLKVGIERFLYFEEKKTGRQTVVPICIDIFTVDKFLTGNGILNPGDREEDDQSSEWRSLPRHHNTLHQWGRKIILDKFLLIQFYDRSCIKLLKDLYWYYFLFRALVSLFPAPVLSLVWRPWWSHLGLSGAGTLPAPTPLEMFFSFKISFSMLSFCIQARHSNELYCAWSHWNWGHDMDFFLLLPWFLGLFCILSHNARVTSIFVFAL